MQHTRRAFLASIGAAGTGVLAGCSGGDSESGETTNIGMVYATGGLGDDSFNDMAHDGIQEAESEFDITYQNAEPDDPSEVGSLQRNFARSSDPDYALINTIGFVQKTPLMENAQEFSDQYWTIVDEVAEDDEGNHLENVESYVFREHEGSFQVGVLAGLLTSQEFSAGGGETNTDSLSVGFVGGQEIPLIERFEAGYTAGVNYVNDDITVQSTYAGDWNVPDVGQELARSMYQDGADVVYHAAGGTGIGVFEAAQSEGRYAIGVDNDQSVSAAEFSDVIVASMVKRVNNAVYESTRRVLNDEFEGGVVNDLGLEENGVEAVVGQDFEGELPSAVTDELATTREQIINGDLTVPETLENV